MPTNLGIRGGTNAQGLTAMQRIEQMTTDEARQVLDKLEGQIQRADGGVKSGVLTLMHLNDATQDVTFERKSWYQFKARSQANMQQTARALELLIDKAGLTTLDSRRSFADYLTRRSNKVGTETLSTLLRSKRPSPDAGAVPTAEANVKQALKAAGLVGPIAPQKIQQIAKEMAQGEYGTLVSTLRAPPANDPRTYQFGPAVVVRCAKALFGERPAPALLAHFAGAAFASNAPDQEGNDLHDIDDDSDDDRSQDGALEPPGSLSPLTLEVGVHAYQGDAVAMGQFLQGLNSRVELQAWTVNRLVDAVEPSLDNRNEEVIAQAHQGFIKTVRDFLNDPQQGRALSQEDRATLLEQLPQLQRPMPDAAQALGRMGPPPAGGRVQVQGLDLTGHRLHDAKLINMTGGTLDRSLITGGLRDAQFHRVDMRGMDTGVGIRADRLTFSQCDLTGARLNLKLDYPTSLLSQVDFRGSDLTDASVTIDYTNLVTNAFADAPQGAHASIFNHLNKDHRTSPLTMIDSIPQQFLPLKVRLMREAVTHLADQRLISQLSEPLADLMRKNPAYLQDPVIRQRVGPVVIASLGMPEPARSQLGLDLLKDVTGMTEVGREDFMRQHPAAVNLLLLQEHLLPLADPAKPQEVAQRAALRSTALSLETQWHQRPEVAPIVRVLEQSALYDQSEFTTGWVAQNGKQDLMMIMPIDGRLALAMTYQQFEALIRKPDSDAFNATTPLRVSANGGEWELGPQVKPDHERCIRSIPMLADRYAALVPTPPEEALKTAFGKSAAFEEIIVPALKGLPAGRPPAEVHALIEPALGDIYEHLDQQVEIRENVPAAQRVVYTWDRPQLRAQYLEQLQTQARKVINVDNPREWALYLLNLSISVGRLGSNATLGSHSDSVNALRFHAYKLMEAARAADASLFSLDTWQTWGSQFQDINKCAEILTGEMLTASRDLDRPAYEKVIPAMYRAAA